MGIRADARPVPASIGLTEPEIAARRRRGEVNTVPRGPSRTVGEIIRANVLTRFNFLLAALLAVILAVAPIQDALFGIVLVVNALIGIVQELRAKRTLDRLTVIGTAQCRVVREGAVQDVPIEEIVLDDVLEVRPGDSIVVDGRVLVADELEVDESLLTGESDPVDKPPGSECRSGSFVVAGVGRYRATRVGADAYATQLAEQARRFTLAFSELRAGVDWVLRLVGWAIVPMIALLVWSQLSVTGSIKEGLRGAVAGAVAMVPQGLVLLTSMAFAIGVIRLGRRMVLVRELAAVEGLARVDTVCFDKTGTITEGRLEVLEIVPLDPGVVVKKALGAMAAADRSPNATMQAIARAVPPPPAVPVRQTVPFSAHRKWSAFTGDGRTWVLGAPEVVSPSAGPVLADASARAADGQRVLVLASSATPPNGYRLPADLRPAALVALGDRLRTEAPGTLAYFAGQGVAAKVISGDHPATVAAVARKAGLSDGSAVDGGLLPDDPDRLAETVERHAVFGRVEPQQKLRMIDGLRRRGHVVAMIGDGVNDVLAVKEADVGIALGSGSAATRSVAELVLLDSDFDALPEAVAEGRRVIGNIERAANLFVTKTVYALLLALAIAGLGIAFPFLPRHLTLVAALTIGIPGFFLAVERVARRYRPGFMGRVMRFAVPTGALAAGATLAAYTLGRAEGISLVEARTVAALVLAAVGFIALTVMSRPLVVKRRLLIAALVGALLLLLAVPAGRAFFALDLPRLAVVLAAAGIVAVTGAVIYGALRASGWYREAGGDWRELAGEGGRRLLSVVRGRRRR